MFAKITITTFENYLNSHNDSLFKDITLPTGINRDAMIKCILLRCAEFECFYADPYYMKTVTNLFFVKHYQTFEKWLEGLACTWNPIENYDRYEDYKGNVKEDRQGKREDESTSHDETTASGSGETANDVTTYESATYKPEGKSTSSSSSGSSADGTNNSKAASTDNMTGEDSHTSHIHGNIGVTQAGDMVLNWMETWQWNIYEHIADLYKDEFCVGVYV